MKKNKIITIGLLAVLTERLICFAQLHFILPDWFEPLKWILLVATFICIILYFKYRSKERK